MAEASQKKKVLLMVTKSNWGGAQRHVYDIATTLPYDEYDVVVACGGNGRLYEKLQEARIRTIQIPSLQRNISLFKELKSLFSFYSIIKNERPDVLHLHSPKAGGLGAVCGRALGIPRIIYTAHGWSFNEDRGVVWKSLAYFFSWLTTVFSHTVVTIAEKEYSQAQKFPGVLKKTTLIPLGIQSVMFKSRSEARLFFEEKIGRKTEDYTIIGTIAELHNNKGLSYAIDSIAELKKQHQNLLYVVIGDGEKRGELERHIKRLNLERSVYLIGFQERAAEYLKAFDVFFLPSLKEGLPYVLLEAGYAEVPCVATQVGGIPELLSNESGIVVPTKNSNALRDALHTLITQPNKRTLYARNLKEVIEKKHTIQKMIGSLTHLYNS